MSRGFGTRAQPVTKHGVAASARGASTTPTREPRNDACRTPEHPCAGPLPRHDSAESVDAFCPRAAVRTADDTKNESAAFSESWRGIQVGCRSTEPAAEDAALRGSMAPRDPFGDERVVMGPNASIGVLQRHTRVLDQTRAAAFSPRFRSRGPGGRRQNEMGKGDPRAAALWSVRTRVARHAAKRLPDRR